MVQKIPKNHI